MKILYLHGFASGPQSKKGVEFDNHSAAIMAHQYEGLFSALAFPMVNKAVLMAGTQDSNADGAIGKSNFAWSGQPSDAEDGAGQINLAFVKTTLDNNRYYWNDLTDGNFASCGTNCREVIVASVTVNANMTTRVALAWHACMENEGSLPFLNNDLDLVLNCGSPFVACGGAISSTSVTSELEIVERPGCSFAKTCSIRIRIKNGATLNACGANSAERVGVAWSMH
jgi:hypothetical protein